MKNLSLVEAACVLTFLFYLTVAAAFSLLMGWLVQLVLAAFGVIAPLWACALAWFLLCCLMSAGRTAR
jgi:hypothetical protein